MSGLSDITIVHLELSLFSSNLIVMPFFITCISSICESAGNFGARLCLGCAGHADYGYLSFCEKYRSEIAAHDAAGAGTCCAIT